MIVAESAHAAVDKAARARAPLAPARSSLCFCEYLSTSAPRHSHPVCPDGECRHPATSVQAAFFNIRLVRVPVDNDFKCDLSCQLVPTPSLPACICWSGYLIG